MPDFDVFVCGAETYATYDRFVPAPLFFREFVLKKPPEVATLAIAVAGFYELYLNGRRITRGFLAPYVNNPDDVLYYETYDLKDKLEAGTNRLEVLLGNGFANPVGGEIWQHDRGSFRRAPCFALSFASDEVTFCAADMKMYRSGLLFDDMRCGTWFDATVTPQKITDPIVTTRPKGVLRELCCEPVTAVRRIPPVWFRPGEMREYRVRDAYRQKLHTRPTAMGESPLCGGYIYDFGENVAGVCELKIRAARGQKIELQFSELLTEGFVDYINVDVYPNGCCQRDVYVCRGEGEETYVPPFTYHGFRYVYVSGITPEQATADLLTCLVLRNDLKETAGFSCSEEVSCRIFEACKRSDESNLVNNITDCPQREKNGWTGDAAVSADHMMLLFDASRMFREFLANMRPAGQNGRYPMVIPSATPPDDCPIWDSLLCYAPYAVYTRTGDLAIIRENADAIMQNLSFWFGKRDERGIIESGLGDWLPVDGEAFFYHSPPGFCCSAVFLDCCAMAEKMMAAVGRTADAAACRAMHDDLLPALRAEYIEGGIVTAGATPRYRHPSYRPCQTSQVLGLAFGLFAEEHRPAALRKLVALIHEKGDAFDCGFLGLRYLFRVLSDNGMAQLAHRLITRPEHPSYANMVYRGETTVVERFARPGARIASHNHHFKADVSAWYIRYVLGLKPNPTGDDPNLVEVSPCHLPAIAAAQGFVATPDGKVEAEVTNDPDLCRITLRVTGAARITLKGIPPEQVTLRA